MRARQASSSVAARIGRNDTEKRTWRPCFAASARTRVVRSRTLWSSDSPQRVDVRVLAGHFERRFRCAAEIDRHMRLLERLHFRNPCLNR